MVNARAYKNVYKNMSVLQFVCKMNNIDYFTFKRRNKIKLSTISFSVHVKLLCRILVPTESYFFQFSAESLRIASRGKKPLHG